MILILSCLWYKVFFPATEFGLLHLSLTGFCFKMSSDHRPSLPLSSSPSSIPATAQVKTETEHALHPGPITCAYCARTTDGSAFFLLKKFLLKNFFTQESGREKINLPSVDQCTRGIKFARQEKLD